jgi:hypothetical protein
MTRSIKRWRKTLQRNQWLKSLSSKFVPIKRWVTPLHHHTMGFPSWSSVWKRESTVVTHSLTHLSCASSWKEGNLITTARSGWLVTHSSTLTITRLFFNISTFVLLSFSLYACLFSVYVLLFFKFSHTKCLSYFVRPWSLYVNPSVCFDSYLCYF